MRSVAPSGRHSDAPWESRIEIAVVMTVNSSNEAPAARMVRVSKVEIDVVEGRPTTRVFLGADALRHADEFALSAKRPTLGCHKSDAIVTWEDGSTFEFRFDIESGEKNLFSEELFKTIAFNAGVYRPAHLTEDAYAECLSEIGVSSRKNHYKLATRYQLLSIGAGRGGERDGIPYPQGALEGVLG